MVGASARGCALTDTSAISLVVGCCARSLTLGGLLWSVVCWYAMVCVGSVHDGLRWLATVDPSCAVQLLLAVGASTMCVAENQSLRLSFWSHSEEGADSPAKTM